MAYGEWPEWEPTWPQQQQHTLVFSEGQLGGGTQVLSKATGKSRTRNGTRVKIRFLRDGQLQPYACEVQCFVELTQDGSQGAVRQYAIVRRLNTQVRRDQPWLAEELLECIEGDFEAGGTLFAVPLSGIDCCLHTCSVRRGQKLWWMFVPVEGRSKKPVLQLSR
jgi:hypothetical protein